MMMMMIIIIIIQFLIIIVLGQQQMANYRNSTKYRHDRDYKQGTNETDTDKTQ
jgi:DNA-binding transcriptional regulator of glucitol operon